MNSESELIKALASLENTPDPEIEYRLYYNDAGDIVMCSMREPHPTSAQYVIATAKEYELYFRYRVINDRLIPIEYNDGVLRSLIPGNCGNRVVAGHAALLLEPGEQYTDTEYYEYRTS